VFNTEKEHKPFDN